MGIAPDPIAEVIVFTSGVYPPAAGTPVMAADIVAGLQPLANRTAYLSLTGLLDVVSASGSGGGDLDSFNTASFVKSTAVVIDVPDCEIGDDLVISFMVNYYVSAAGTAEGRLELFVTDDFGVTAAIYELTSTTVYQGTHGGAAANQQATMVAHHVVYAAGTTRVAVAGKVTAADGSAIAVSKGFHAVVQRARRVLPTTPDAPA